MYFTPDNNANKLLRMTGSNRQTLLKSGQGTQQGNADETKYVWQIKISPAAHHDNSDNI